MLGGNELMKPGSEEACLTETHPGHLLQFVPGGARLPTLREKYEEVMEDMERKNCMRRGQGWTVDQYNMYRKMFLRLMEKIDEFEPDIDIPAMEAAVRAREVFKSYEEYQEMATKEHAGTKFEKVLEREQFQEKFYHYDDAEGTFHEKFTKVEWGDAADVGRLQILVRWMATRTHLNRALNAVPGGVGFWKEAVFDGPCWTEIEKRMYCDHYHNRISELAYSLSQQDPSRSELENWFLAENTSVPVSELLHSLDRHVSPL